MLLLCIFPNASALALCWSLAVWRTHPHADISSHWLPTPGKVLLCRRRIDGTCSHVDEIRICIADIDSSTSSREGVVHVLFSLMLAAAAANKRWDYTVKYFNTMRISYLNRRARPRSPESGARVNLHAIALLQCDCHGRQQSRSHGAEQRAQSAERERKRWTRSDD